MKFKLIKVDGNCTCILNGHIFVSDTLTSEEEMRLVSFGKDVTEEEASQIIEIFNPKLSEIRENNKQVQELVDVLLESGLFEEKNGSYYRVGNPISVPKMLLEKYRDALQESDEMAKGYFESLDNFWLKCSLNPVPENRENLFWFLDKWGFTITSKGYFVAYRNVDIMNEGDRQLHDFVALNYTKIKAQKKAPKNYLVIKVVDTENVVNYYLEDMNRTAKIAGTCLGNLQDLYNNLSNLSETVYTDQRTRSFKIKLGTPVSMPREQCDFSQATCSRGLHCASAGWLKNNRFGKESLVVLVNPMDVISIPVADSYGKIRTCQYYPYSLVETDENGDIVPIDSGVFEDDYEQFTIDELNKLLQEINPANQVIHQLTFSEVPNQVYTTIDEYRTILENKNQSIYPDYDYRNSEYDEDGDYDDDEYGYDYLDEEE